MLNPALPLLDRLRSSRGSPAGSRSPGRGPLLALAVGALFVGPAVSASAEDQPPPIEYQLLRPEKPGDRYALRFSVPRGQVPAVLIKSLAESTDDEPSSVKTLVPLAVDPSGTYTGFDGVVPAGVTPEELEAASIHLWIILFDPWTQLYHVSDPLPLLAEDAADADGSFGAAAGGSDDGAPSAPGPNGPSGAGDGDDDAASAPGKTGPSGVTGADDADDGGAGPNKNSPSGAGGSSASTGGDPEIEHVSEEDGTDGSSNPKSGASSIGWNLLSQTPLAILALSSLSSAAMLTIYDQPTPVQGSGH